MRAGPVLARTAAVALGALALAAPAAGAAEPHRMVVAFDVHVLQVTDWRYWTAPDSAAEPSWTHAAGTQTLGWSMRRPLVADVDDMSRFSPALDFPPLVIAPRRAGTARLTARRDGDWLDHAEYACDSEGGCGGQATRVVETHPPASCPQRRLRTTLGFDLGVAGGRRALLVSVGQLPGPLWTTCARMDLRTDGVSSIALPPSAIRRLQHLRAGRTLTLEASSDAGYDGATPLTRCPERLTGDGIKECTVTEVVVRAHRLR